MLKVRKGQQFRLTLSVAPGPFGARAPSFVARNCSQESIVTATNPRTIPVNPHTVTFGRSHAPPRLPARPRLQSVPPHTALLAVRFRALIQRNPPESPAVSRHLGDPPKMNTAHPPSSVLANRRNATSEMNQITPKVHRIHCPSIPVPFGAGFPPPLPAPLPPDPQPPAYPTIRYRIEPGGRGAS